ncbi:MAG: FKBP-type peptidyl-prolyl cis-trans isomerase [Tannerellaceae bacterium]|jgi:FKBP-type peptidyl-prolyl cis-trans isomerase SlyD|nr:FKBP-type peptidyl-prolyl cis-trans isomerase [Tannerellaceae bacterium]
MKIAANKFVTVIYDLNVGEGEERELMERATAEVPLSFIFGTGMMLAAFEDGLKGLKTGSTFSFTITPDNGYGAFNEEHIMELPKNMFEVDGKFDSDTVKEGNVVPMLDGDGNRLNGAVIEIKKDAVIMDFNHPLAGETLHFTGEIIDVHDPSAEEIASMSSAGCDCGCGCEDDACSGGGCKGCGC